MPVRLYAGSDRISWIRWYKAAPGARIFPRNHAFASTFWEGDYSVTFRGPGAVNYTDLYANGRNRGYPGTCTPANLDWFLTGIPADAPPAGSVVCCHPALYASGGVSAVGSGYTPLPPINVVVDVSACACGFTFWELS